MGHSNNKGSFKKNPVAIGIGIGIIFGAALSNVALGIGVGIAVGAAIALDQKKKMKTMTINSW